jgi:AraC-like DNA-binding protein/mannose-6-phosphate isomerase-like protein (cupin superfamily)
LLNGQGVQTLTLAEDLQVDRAVNPDVRFRRWIRKTPSSWKPPSAVHDEVEVTWVESGALRYRVGREPLEVAPGTVMVVPAGIEHQTEFLGPLTAGSVRLSSTLCDEVAAVLRMDRRRAIPIGAHCRPDKVIALGNLLASELTDGAPQHERMVDALAEALAVELLRHGEPIRKESAHDPRIDRAIEFLRAEFRRPLRVDEIARAAGLSRFHFSHLFHQATGRAPYRYLLELRLSHVAARLRRGGTTATEAALDAGFTDLGRFHRMFRDHFGRRPSEFLREAGSHDSPHDSHDPH